MTTQRKPWVGLGGVPPRGNALAHSWEKRLQWPMIGVGLLRLALVGLLLTRILGSLRNMFSPGGIPFIIGLGAITLGIAGAGFYWIEPTVHSYADGVWLAFVTGSTVGYGDVVPTTTASR